MTRLIAAVDTGPMRASIIDTATALVPLLADRVDIVTIGVDDTEGQDLGQDEMSPVAARPGSGEPMVGPGRQLVALTTEEDVTGIVVGLRSVVGGPRPAGHIAEQVITHSSVPVVAVPPEVDRSADPLARVLLPLEGEPDGDGPIGRFVGKLLRRGSSVDTIHVFDRASAPMFWDGWHEHDVFAHQFADRFSPTPDPTELRVGGVAQQVLEAAVSNESTLIVLLWKRDLSASRAPVVRDLLCNTTVPLLLVPVTGRAEAMS